MRLNPRLTSKLFEITFIDSGKTVRWLEPRCIEYFGRDEWPEYVAGYLPHVVVVEIGNEVY